MRSTRAAAVVAVSCPWQQLLVAFNLMSAQTLQGQDLTTLACPSHSNSTQQRGVRRTRADSENWPHLEVSLFVLKSD